MSLAITTTLIVPAGMQISAGIGFDNDNGTSAISAAQLDALGAVAYNPATVGTDGSQSLYIPPPHFAVNSPGVVPFGTPFSADYGWTVDAAPVPEPSSLLLLLNGVLP